MLQPDILSAAKISLGVDGYTVPISEIRSVTSSVDKHEMLFCDEKGNLNHTKQYGKTVPPSVTLITPLIPAYLNVLYTWHNSVRAGEPGARRDAQLMASPSSKLYTLTYTLFSAWLTKLDLGSVKAGASESGQVTFTLECDHIEITSSGGNGL